MFAVDIVGFSGRPAHVQRRLRDVLYLSIENACDAVGLDFRRCIHEDRGDGLFAITPFNADVGTALNPLYTRLGDALAAHNHTVDDVARIRLRMAVHAGYYQRDEHGITSPDLIHLFRLLDSAELRRHVAAQRTPLGLIVSDYLFSNARSYGLIDPAEYGSTEVEVNGTATTAWLRHPAE